MEMVRDMGVRGTVLELVITCHVSWLMVFQFFLNARCQVKVVANVCMQTLDVSDGMFDLQV